MTEAEILDAAFAARLQALYAVFANSYDAAQGDPTQLQAALQRFEAGLRNARASRDLAKACLN